MTRHHGRKPPAIDVPARETPCETHWRDLRTHPPADAGNAPSGQPRWPCLRPDTVPAVGGALRVAGMKMLNYFDSFSGCTGSVGGAAMDCRGADNATEFTHQQAKTVTALVQMQADVVGLVEI